VQCHVAPGSRPRSRRDGKGAGPLAFGGDQARIPADGSMPGRRRDAAARLAIEPPPARTRSKPSLSTVRRGPARPGSNSSPCGSKACARVAPRLLGKSGVNQDNLIAVREVRSGGRRVVVELYRNDGGSVAARLVFAPRDMPIIDGANAEEALATIEDALEGLLLARRAAGR
jgi:hypothetical protein